jgi:hypothetical protein
MKKLIILFFFTFSVSAQETETEIPFPLTLYNKCFDDLKPMKYISENSSWKDSDLCNLTMCSLLLAVKDPEAVAELKKRIIEITRKLFENGTPIKLISGLDSFVYAEKLNENLKDDNGIVYISIAACILSEQESLTKEIVNAETNRLIKLKIATSHNSH